MRYSYRNDHLCNRCGRHVELAATLAAGGGLAIAPTVAVSQSPQHLELARDCPCGGRATIVVALPVGEPAVELPQRVTRRG